MLDWHDGAPFPSCRLGGVAHSLVLVQHPKKHSGGCSSMGICLNISQGWLGIRNVSHRFIRDEGPIPGSHQKSLGVVYIDVCSSLSGCICILALPQPRLPALAPKPSVET